MEIGPYTLANQLILAPMAGVTDRPFRSLCVRMGAGMAVSEMVTSNSRLWHTRKTRLRLDHSGEQQPRSVQIAGTDPVQMAEAARFNVDNGAQIIDINMGCPAKKVCNVMAGSALMKDESLVADILDAVVSAVKVPVTLKIRTGWDPDSKNAASIAHIAESSGIQALTVHGRTRACGFKGEAEYETIRTVKSSVAIPVIANGDINGPRKAAEVLDITGADGLMIGRAAQGNPWIFSEINHFLETGKILPPPPLTDVQNVLINHLKNLYDFYGNYMGVRIARKHIGWYCRHHPDTDAFKQQINRVESTQQQLDLVSEFFSNPKGGLLAA
ncbi:MAG: tRNA dihydrouridine synthase DusB [Thiotrichales bacterium]|nr:MAG: tRNA dihydrouridine synthase DusB [Thiotrichales bacterium]